MKTVYCYLDARRVEASRSACGGEDAPRRYVLPRRQEAACGGRRDNVLDFAACRRAMSAEEPPAEELKRAPAHKTRWIGLALDACATAAIVAFTALACLQFL